MAGESPNSSWHPALMPNAQQAASTEPVTDATRATSLPKEPASQLDETTAREHESQTTTGALREEEAGNGWFSENGDDDGDAWLGSRESQSQIPAGQVPAEAAEPEPIMPPKPKGVTSLHSSSLSFARTVSHEVSFGDDDDGDWNLSRTDTDPFRFMPPSDRTNSFPPVPPIASSSEPHGHQPHQQLPSNQASDVLEEVERDMDTVDYEGQLLPGQHAPVRERASSKSMGGNYQALEQHASEARYEEGLPLISHAESQDHDTPGSGNAASAFVHSFVDESGNADDFFSQVQGLKVGAVPNGEPIQPLERKSTMQVMNSMNSMNESTLSRQSTLQERHEEDGEEEEEEEKRARAEAKKPTSTDDLAAKWEQAFLEDDDDNEFLLDDSTENRAVDPAAFFGSDDEGFLDDEDEPTPIAPPAPQQPSALASSQPSGSSPYVPQAAAAQQSPRLSYVPTGAISQPPVPAPLPSSYIAPAPVAPFTSAPQYGAPPAPKPDLPRAQSFADKSKGGYSSPYDLPTDLVTTTVKPRKRASMQSLPGSGPTLGQPAPPRSSSMAMAGPPPSTMSPPGSSHGSATHAPTHPQQKHIAPPHKESFFEELPVTVKPRSSSRQSFRAPSPAQQPPMAHPHIPSPLMPPTTQLSPPPAPAAVLAPNHQPPVQPQVQTPVHPPPHHPAGTGGLVAPEKVSPYAALQTPAHHIPPPSTNTARYSPAPGHTPHHMVPPAAPSSRYSPAPTATKAHGPYGAVGSGVAPMLPHLPRTSSPLTHCENHQGETTIAERRASSSFEPRLNRVSSLPPTREVDEEDEPVAPRSLSAAHPPNAVESKYNPMSPPKAARQTPPPPTYASQATFSPPKRSSSYVPNTLPPAQPGFVPPPRAQTQSPSATFGHKSASRSSDSTKRPSSAHSPASPVMTKAGYTAYAPTSRPRGPSLNMNLVAPTDGREKDPLQRWKGVPIFAWGVGGSMITSFPNSVPRYGMNQTAPAIIRTPGEVKIRNVRDIEPLPERLAKFPGPLKGKSKKKETIAWLTAGIETLEKDLPEVSFHAQLSLEAKRAIERLLLWKILRVFVEYDGALEGSPAVEKAVREILAPGTITPTADDDGLFPGKTGLGVEATSVTPMQADGADTATMDQIRHHLLRGDREKAVWDCVDKRLWGHAMLISHTASPDLYKRVAQEFVRKEVNYPGHSNESMAALYKILSGNYDDCVDELVPVHARAGLQLMSTQFSAGPTKDTLDGLDKWRETLCLVLSNRSNDDVRGLNALGTLLSSYGRAEAAHVCFIFSRAVSIFGGLDDPNANFVLIGSDHHQQSDQFAKETEALQLSEVYEYGLSLAGGAAAAAGTPHLAAYKFQHAMVLAEYGYRDKALQYCDAIAHAIMSQTKRSPYHHVVLDNAVDDFMVRLKQAPKDESNSWISKPSMNKVSDSMWNRFNKFVSGEDNENGNGAVADGEAGPFGRIATPTMSRSPSVSNFEVYSGQSPAYPAGVPQLPTTAAASRYAPSAGPAPAANPYEPTSQYVPTARSSMERTSGEHPRNPNPYEPSYPGTNSAAASNGGYTPSAPLPSAPKGGSIVASAPVLAPPAQITPSYQPYGVPASASMPTIPTGEADKESEKLDQGLQPMSYGYEPPQMTPNPPEPQNEEPPADTSTGEYEPPSFQPYGYEPPSYEPDPEPENDDDAPKPKKKSFMDDDDDDIPALNPKEKAKSEKDRENEEMFRKIAEEDAKRAAAQHSKKGWGFSGWFGGGKKAETPSPGESSPGKPIRAKLGEASSFVYDPELKRWINKKPGAENTAPKTATPPPPKGGPRSVSGTPPPPMATPPPPLTSSTSAPPPLMPPRMRAATPDLSKPPSMESLAAPPMRRSVSSQSVNGPPSAPPSRPPTSMSNASSIDDLLSAAPRKAGQKKGRKSGRYVDVMAK